MNRKDFTKAIIIGAIIVLVGVTAYLTLVKRSTGIKETGTNGSDERVRTYRGDSFEFRYPSELLVASQGEGVLVTHSVAYRHDNPCDFKGNGQPLDKITDFDIFLRVFSNGLKETMGENETAYLMDNYFQGATIETLPGFIDEYNIGALSGYQVTSGAEGCGRYTYYFPLSAGETLFVSRAFVPELQPINVDYREYLNVSGIILPEEEESFFKAIISSFRLGR
jgi:hypothetical protein